LKIIKDESGVLINKSFSSASLSHKLFYKKYNLKNIKEKIMKNDENFIRNAYFGGRCEVFGNPENNEHIKYYDFSGMYGQCMQEKFHNGNSKYYKNADTCLPGFHTIRYRSNFNFLPILPVRVDNKLFFPNGEYTGTF
jgi:hypothetical protein